MIYRNPTYQQLIIIQIIHLQNVLKNFVVHIVNIRKFICIREKKQKDEDFSFQEHQH